MQKALTSFLITLLCFICIYSLHCFFISQLKNSSLIAAFGAAVVLSFSNLKKTFTSTTIILGAAIGALIGVSFNLLIKDNTIAIILSISTCVFVMQICNINYPPGGAIAIIPITASQELQNLGYLFTFFPVLIGIICILSFSSIQNYINHKSNKLWQVKKQLKS